MPQDNPVYINTQSTTPGQNLPTDESNQPQQWIAIHNMQIIGMYNSQGDAVNGLNGYKMQNMIELNDVTGVYQII